MDHRVIEIVFDVVTIPGINPNNAVDPRALRFRDATLVRVDEALGQDDLGHALEADIIAGDLILRFMVQDFDAAEARIKEALGEGQKSSYRELNRYWEDLAAA